MSEYPIFLHNALSFTQPVSGAVWKLGDAALYDADFWLMDLAWAAPRIQRWLDSNHFSSSAQEIRVLFKRWLELANNFCDWSLLEPKNGHVEEIRLAVKRLAGLVDA